LSGSLLSDEYGFFSDSNESVIKRYGQELLSTYLELYSLGFQKANNFKFLSTHNTELSM